ncbi:MAG: hypothetical protein Q9226_005059 [Calogaya cf. arnoldii]
MANDQTDRFEGWFGLDKDTGVGGMKWQEFEPKKFEENDVDIKITHCACADCEACSSGAENHCMKLVQTYNSRHPDGTKTYGGYANHWRGPSDWVFAIPSSMAPAEAAPMLCAGITLYSPLKRFGCGPGKTVGIIGIGGLGHFGILFAKALGADKVLALSRNNSKREDALKLGADEYVATDEDADWVAKHACSLDLVINTVANTKVPLNEYFSLLRANGTFVQIGAPDLPPPSIGMMCFRGLQLAGSLIGPPAEIREMLEFAAKHGVHPIVQEKPMKEANQVVMDVDKGLARYRYVLVN